MCVYKCMYICVYEIMEQPTRPPTTSTPMHIQEFPRPLLPFITHWAGLQISVIAYYNERTQIKISQGKRQ